MCAYQVNITSAKLRSKGLLQLTLATLQPATRYQITVSADDTIMDGFGLPLKVTHRHIHTQRTQGLCCMPFDPRPVAPLK